MSALSLINYDDVHSRARMCPFYCLPLPFKHSESATEFSGGSCEQPHHLDKHLIEILTNAALWCALWVLRTCHVRSFTKTKEGRLGCECDKAETALSLFPELQIDQALAYQPQTAAATSAVDKVNKMDYKAKSKILTDTTTSRKATQNWVGMSQIWGALIWFVEEKLFHWYKSYDEIYDDKSWVVCAITRW